MYSNAVVTAEKIRIIKDSYNGNVSKTEISETVDLPYEMITTILTKLREKGLITRPKTIKEKINEAFKEFMKNEKLSDSAAKGSE